MLIHSRLKPEGLVHEVTWDLSRENSWRSKFEEAKADIEKVNAELQRGIHKRVADAKRNMAGRSREEIEQAIAAAAYAETRAEIIRNLRGQLAEGRVDIWNGPVEFYAAYQSRTDFEQLHPNEDAVQQGVERVNFLIQHRLAVPDEPSQKLLDRVIGLVTDKKFKDRRRQFYDYQIHLLEGGQKPELILKDLDRLVADYNAQALAKGEKCRWETVITVFAVAGAFLAAWPVYLPAGSSLAATAAIAGAVSSVGPAVWSKLQAREDVDASQKIAAGGAMFHQIEAESGFQFLTSRRSLGR